MYVMYAVVFLRCRELFKESFRVSGFGFRSSGFGSRCTVYKEEYTGSYDGE